MAKLENLELVNDMINQKYLNVQRHPNADIWLYNYSAMCQIEHVWNDVTITCRGLICDSDYNIIARPFPKFFNYEEIDDKSIIPDHLPFEVYEKLDGSLGIMYWIDDVPYITTRGSFVSDQAKHATNILHNKYSKYFDLLDKTKTYLFEIIYKDDKHCVSYGDIDDIFLLAVIDIETGNEDDINNWAHIFTCTKKYDGVSDYTKIRDLFDGDNREGFVVKFANNFRIKMKYEAYFKLAFLMNHLSEKVILDAYIYDNISDIEYQISLLNEENQIYFNNIKEKILLRYQEIEKEALSYYQEFDTDKEAAAYFLTIPKYSGILFNKRRDKDYSKGIWKIIRNEMKSNNN